ncbi:hypothetical protein [Streptomyces avidinii]|uniref:Uncharacterized protein n=1 Tax=Streptomyces avidinii TaxID=1895 RepID=A0ABS4L773_STRAV|nr:hypothetical protein [Streptomyces avidinii]MBP2037969.1 hypothetical protein [Streptomyces avidinii]GGZ07268.1 hypothetical protein GCM10010343_36730 [Streptomyces avidinii]
MSGTTGGEAKGVRPKGAEMAWRLTLAAVAATAVDWVLGAFVIEPTGLGELTAYAGADDAARRLALSGGVLLVMLAGWLAVAVRMRAGRGWARTVLGVVGAGGLLFLATDLSMSGTQPGIGPALAGLPELLAAAAVFPMFLPGARARFRARPHRG